MTLQIPYNMLKLKDKPRERVAEVAQRKNSCHNCGSTDHYSNNFTKAKKKVYAIEKVPEEESPKEDFESDSMGDAIREQYDEEQDPREEFLVEYQEQTPLEIQDIRLEAGMPQDNANKNLCKHTRCTKIPGHTNQRNGIHTWKSHNGAHCSIVARNYLDRHLPEWGKQLFPTKEKNFKGASGKMNSIGKRIKEIIIPHRNGNSRLK
ncbi:hypothetical protein O181_078454 [Austropuccinia psidii MF-1]|uniref:Uncharacterized protein n=1 Tax=Austropuccinia psidii MF-1 TaxID=1389203 RepID=A0A9Q3FGK0_9BASI|nr:hypothetical protein [Austropuccinia psidii MF-1]